MIRLLLIVLLLLPVDAGAMQMIGFGAGSETCATQTYDWQFESTYTSTTVDEYKDGGQSWTSGSGVGDKKLYSISLRRHTTSSTTQLTIRIGTGTDLATDYMVEFSCDVPNATGFFECVIPEASRPTLAASTVYRAFYTVPTGYSSVAFSRSSGSGISGGNNYYDTVHDWSPPASGHDLSFKTRMCD